MEEQLDTLNHKLEFQIETMFDTIIKIQEIEKENGPAPHISYWHEKTLSICFYHILMRNMWDLMNKGRLSKKSRERYVKDVGRMTYEHFLNLYGFDTKKDIGNQK